MSEVNKSLEASDNLYKIVRETVKKTLLASDTDFKLKRVISPLQEMPANQFQTPIENLSEKPTENTTW